MRGSRGEGHLDKLASLLIYLGCLICITGVIPGSTRVIRRGVVRCGAVIPIPTRSYDPVASLDEFADCSWPLLHFRPINFTEEPASPIPLASSLPRIFLRTARSSSFVANFNQLAQLADPWHTIHPIDRCSCYEDLNETSDTDRCDPFILLSRPFLYPRSSALLYAPRRLFPPSIRSGARCRSKRRIYNPGE